MFGEKSRLRAENADLRRQLKAFEDVDPAILDLARALRREIVADLAGPLAVAEDHKEAVERLRQYETNRLREERIAEIQRQHAKSLLPIFARELDAREGDAIQRTAITQFNQDPIRLAQLTAKAREQLIARYQKEAVNESTLHMQELLVAEAERQVVMNKLTAEARLSKCLNPSDPRIIDLLEPRDRLVVSLTDKTIDAEPAQIHFEWHADEEHRGWILAGTKPGENVTVAAGRLPRNRYLEIGSMITHPAMSEEQMVDYLSFGDQLAVAVDGIPSAVRVRNNDGWNDIYSDSIVAGAELVIRQPYPNLADI